MSSFQHKCNKTVLLIIPGLFAGWVIGGVVRGYEYLGSSCIVLPVVTGVVLAGECSAYTGLGRGCIGQL